jgi:hypothetical protein
MGYGKLRALFRGDLKASDTAFYRDTGSLASQEPDNDRFALGRLPMGGQEDVECDNMLISAQLAQTTHAKNLPVESPDPALPTFDCNDPEAVLPAAKKHYIIAPPSFLALLGFRRKRKQRGIPLPQMRIPLWQWMHPKARKLLPGKLLPRPSLCAGFHA